VFHKILDVLMIDVQVLQRYRLLAFDHERK
jgi:hypothetical protein